MARTKFNANQLALGGATAIDNDARARGGSTAYGDATSATDPGPEVTVVVPASGQVFVSISCMVRMAAIGGGEVAACGLVLSGANTVAAPAHDLVLLNPTTTNQTYAASRLFTGLTAGSTTFKMVYQTNNASVNVHFERRWLSVIPVG